MENQPSLVEPGVKYFLSDALKKTHDYKMKTYSFVLNLAIGVTFFVVFGGFLYYKYKSKPTPEEKHEKMMRDQAIVMSKIRGYKENKDASDITKLPFVDMDYYASRNE
jgi:hypothetical protein